MLNRFEKVKTPWLCIESDEVEARWLFNVAELDYQDQLAAWEEKEAFLKDHLYWANLRLWHLNDELDKNETNLADRERITDLIWHFIKIESRDIILQRFVKTQKEGLQEKLKSFK